MIFLIIEALEIFDSIKNTYLTFGSVNLTGREKALFFNKTSNYDEI